MRNLDQLPNEELLELLKEKRIELFKKYNIVFKKYPSFEKKSSLTGMQNLGNTCYINAIIQALSHNKDFVMYFLQSNWGVKINPLQNFTKGETSCHLYFLLKDLYQDLRVVSPNIFVRHIFDQSKLFEEKMQQDSCEFFLYLMECLNDELRPVTFSKFTP